MVLNNKSCITNCVNDLKTLKWKREIWMYEKEALEVVGGKEREL